MNALVGERLSIITSKAQTTRHRIFGIINGDDFQIVYSDTPGIIAPKYELHRSMMRFVNTSLDDADVVLFVTDIWEDFDEEDALRKLERVTAPTLVLVNKVDQAQQEQVQAKVEAWQQRLPGRQVAALSALHGFNLDYALDFILTHLPLHPPYFPKDQLTNRSERFFAAEIIREKILLNYKQEIPYSTEVVITDFKEAPEIIRVRAEIMVERTTQKGILIGKGGEALKRVGTQARHDMEIFFQKQVYLEQFVKVAPDWRRDRQRLDRFGYNE